MEGSIPHVEEEFDRVWDAMAADPDWKAWMDDHIVANDLYVIAQFEDRTKASLRRSGHDLIYYIPTQWIDAARSEGTIRELARTIFEDAYAGWATRLRVPAPPVAKGIDI